MIIFIDSGVLGILANPNKKGEARDCEQWLYGLLSKSVTVVTSDICDYEIRRSLILESRRNPNINSIENLDELQNIINFLPLTTEVLNQAAYLWAESKNKAIPTADDKNIDVDIIICAHWKLLTAEFPGRNIVIATTNTKHLSRFTQAQKWNEISF